MTPSPADGFDLDLPDDPRRKRESRRVAGGGLAAPCDRDRARPLARARTLGADAHAWGSRLIPGRWGWGWRRRWQAADARLYFAPGFEVSRPGAGYACHAATTRPTAASSPGTCGEPESGACRRHRRGVGGNRRSGDGPGPAAVREAVRRGTGTGTGAGTGPGNGGGEGGTIRPPEWRGGALPFGQTPKALRGTTVTVTFGVRADGPGRAGGDAATHR
jgi:hypothetical protein